MAISDREKKYWEDKGAADYYQGKDNKNPHDAPALIEVGDSIFGMFLGDTPRMERQSSYDKGYGSAKKGK